MQNPKQDREYQRIAIHHAIHAPDGVEHLPPGLPQSVDQLIELLVDRLLMETVATSGNTNGNTCND